MKLLSPGYPHVVDEICRFRWSKINRNELLAVCRAYYYFSRQFCETLEIACRRHPLDHQLAELWNAECNTDILSPYPGLAAPGERMSHDEFMRRILAISSLDRDARARVDRLSTEYLADIRRVDATTRIISLPTYKDGGLESIFRAVLLAPDWDEPSLLAFRHFVVGHIYLDSDPDAGHGVLCRHLIPDGSIFPLWLAFRDLLADAAPNLAS
jgi:hypothetical protein